MDGLPKVRSELTPATLQHAIWRIRAGKADATEARNVMMYFCELWNQQAPTPRALLQHLYDAFHAYLYDGRTIEAALGLARRRGRPNAEAARLQMATEVLRLRLTGMSHQDALTQASERCNCGLTVLGEAWAAYKHYAIVLLRKERAPNRNPWSEEELVRLRGIYDVKVNCTGPENSSIKPA